MTSPFTDPAQRNAYDMLVDMFDQMGLGSLASTILKLIQDGNSQDSISYALQQTPEYKQRFAANDVRRKKGLPVLAPREYLAAETAYRQTMQAGGMPPGFWDDQKDFQKFLENDVSPAEVKSRVDLASSAANSLDDATKQAFWQFHGIGPSDIAAFYLDQEKALPQLQKISQTVNVGSAAIRQGLSTSEARASELATSPQAANADMLYGQVASDTREGQKLGQIYGDAYSQKDSEDERFLGLESAKRKRTSLAQKESASFSGSGGTGRSSLSGSNQY